MNPTYEWTKENIKKVIEMWDTKSTREIAESLGVKQDKVSHLVAALKKHGIPMRRKYGHWPTTAFIKEIKNEMNIQ